MNRIGGPNRIFVNPLMAIGLLVLSLVSVVPALADESSRQMSQQIEKAIEAGKEYLWDNFDSEGHWEKKATPAQPVKRVEPWLLQPRNRGGATALAVIALRMTGTPISDRKLQRAARWLEKLDAESTYVVALRAHVLALMNRRESLRGDVQWLVENINAQGGYGYGPGRAAARDDRSNSQYGVLGVWMGHDAGVPVPDEYWRKVEGYWLNSQASDGGWGYRGRTATGYGSMTAAGLATMTVVQELLYANRSGLFDGYTAVRCGEYARVPSIERGLDWFGRNFRADKNPLKDRWLFYYLYAVERAGLATGKKFFGDHDWYEAGAGHLVGIQESDGSWRGKVLQTSFALMFLARGRLPILMNKVQYDGEWDNTPRDLAHLARYFSKRSETPVNWQVVQLTRPIAKLQESPILYLNGHEFPRLSEAEKRNLWEFVHRGGMFFGEACCSSPRFVAGFKSLCEELFSPHRVQELPSDHPIYTINPADTDVKFLAAHNGVRTMALCATVALAQPWHQNLSGRWEGRFNLGRNIYLFATDKSAIRTKFRWAPIEPRGGSAIMRQITVARPLVGAGPSDPEPFGLKRFNHYMVNQTGSSIAVRTGAKLGETSSMEGAKLAFITAVGPLALSDSEILGLRQFVDSGGTVLIDAATGNPEAHDSAINAVEKAFPEGELKSIDASHPLVTGEGMPGAISITDVGMSRRAAVLYRQSGAHVRLEAMDVKGRAAVLISPIDISTSMLGTPIYDAVGYADPSALEIFRNIVLYSVRE
jgi:hypothetical protein